MQLRLSPPWPPSSSGGRRRSSIVAHLPSIEGPHDLRRLDLGELAEVARELRELILETILRNGGHLGAAMGAVELTIAAHYCFESPRDRIVWDVGHQGHAHKILTGRRDTFDSIKREGGLSGFLKRSESEHDIFGAGHASTSISAALGVREGMRLAQASGSVVAIIGDGALTGGMAFEALNNAGALARDLIVVLNDNGMSISPNVGAVSEPRALFESMGFAYLGPVDGHDIAALVRAFEQAKTFDTPVVVHALTRKGEGVPDVDADPQRFHVVPPARAAATSSAAAADTPPSAPTYTQIFAETLCDAAARDPRVVAITAAMPHGTGLYSFQQRFPGRFYDVGIAEQHAVTFAAGLAVEGFRPVVAIYSTFLQRAFDQVMHDVCLQRLPVTICMDRAGIVGADGPTHHGVFDIGYLRMLPELALLAPKDEDELRHMLLTAIECGRPVALRWPRGSGVGARLEGPACALPWGGAELLRESGDDLLVIAAGPLVYEALAACEALATRGVGSTVINARFIKPLDEALLCEHIARANVVLTLEDNALAGGFGSAVLELCETRGLRPKLRRLGIPDRFVPHGDVASLRRQCGLDRASIIERYGELCTSARVVSLA
ncbi:MAG: 1-deoxy-D-xylulose-5-phosphate synthase [Myxococcales bacterium]|nr:1-deoxy-D-xylulose-5-phosphate synthase [Myxococcales bacterium]